MPPGCLCILSASARTSAALLASPSAATASTISNIPASLSNAVHTSSQRVSCSLLLRCFLTMSLRYPKSIKDSIGVGSYPAPGPPIITKVSSYPLYRHIKVITPHDLRPSAGDVGVRGHQPSTSQYRPTNSSRHRFHDKIAHTNFQSSPWPDRCILT